MRLHLHPGKSEAVTLEDRRLTRWALHHRAARALNDALLPDAGDVFPGAWDSAPTPDGALIAIATRRGRAGVVELRDWTTLEAVGIARALPTVTAFIALCFSPDGRWLAVADTEERLLLVDRGSGEVVSSVSTGLCQPSGLVFHPASEYLSAVITDQGGGVLRVWEVRDGHIRTLHEDINDRARTWDFADTFASCSFSRDGTLLAVHACSEWGADTEGWQSEVMLFDWLNARLLWSTAIDSELLGEDLGLERDYFNSHVLFCEDDSRLLTGSAAGYVLALDAATGALWRSVHIGSGTPVRSLHFDPGGDLVWALSGDEIVSLPLAEVLA